MNCCYCRRPTGNAKGLIHISILVFISLCISGAGITILLALSVYQMIVNEKLPATSDAVPLLGN